MTKIAIRDERHIEVVNQQTDDQKMMTTGGFNGRRKQYGFDQIFAPDNNQDDVYEGMGCRNLINRVVEGYHGTIFAYGQTGSGKSFTMEGNEREVPDNFQGEFCQGITQRGVAELFEQIEAVKAADHTKHYSVFCSFLQIYNEKVFDLLNPASVSGITSLR